MGSSGVAGGIPQNVEDPTNKKSPNNKTAEFMQHLAYLVSFNKLGGLKSK